MPAIHHRVLSVLVLFALLSCASCSPFKSMEYRGIDNWNLKPVSFSESILSANVSIYNPNKGTVKVKRLQSVVELAQKPMGELILDSAFAVPGKTVFTLPLQLKINHINLLKSGLNLADKGNIEYKLTGFIKGKYKGFSAKVPFNYPGSFSLSDVMKKQ